ncbi:hypothetical protein HYALB_00004562 [Hymenoscyphus albidus]|uniref:MobA-like NTP transferase domain-containing protein n=1 Tax=Hymenoscyphus albidus TaxID=595503 RepID=A0A9N9LXX3_9HELO|nr:hypothetical protein HYALB_00004562 [Hymenoscyphus albidus]
MEYNEDGPILKPLLIIRKTSSQEGIPKEFSLLPNGKLFYEHSLQTLHEALPRAEVIYVSIHSESQKVALTTKNLHRQSDHHDHNHDHDHDHGPQKFPTVEFILYEEQQDTSGPITALQAAHMKHPESKFLVTSCDFPSLGPAALQQLILEYEEPVTCFVNGRGDIEPLIGIWGPGASGKLDVKRNLEDLVRDLGGKIVKPLRDEWVRGLESEEESV